jgi:hypothetical protein
LVKMFFPKKIIPLSTTKVGERARVRGMLENNPHPSLSHCRGRGENAHVV